MLYTTLAATLAVISPVSAWLEQVDTQRLYDRMYQTALRGPRLPGSTQQNSMLDSIAGAMQVAGLTTDTLNYTMYRWDPRWWSLTGNLKNGSQVAFPTTGYWPYSGDSGAKGVTGKVHDAGTYGVIASNQTANFSTLDLKNLAPGTIAFFDNPSVTKNYSEPGYSVFGTSRNIPDSDIPELGNLTNPHWISAKSLNFTLMNSLNVVAAIASWTDASDANAALQWLPSVALAGNLTQNCPTLYVGNSTGMEIRNLISSNQMDTMSLVLDAPSFGAPTYTLISHLNGTKGAAPTILLYTHSDGPSIIEENGPIMMLSLAEYFSRNKPSINLDFIMTTGHLSGGKLNESAWMSQRPQLMANAKASINIEHLGAIEWKDKMTSSGMQYEATGRLEPMWTFANNSHASDNMRQVYLESFNGSPDSLRMALLNPQYVNGKLSPWYGVGGSSTLGYSNIPTVGIIPQPDYLWAAAVDNQWSRYDHAQAVAQLEVLIQVVSTLDSQYKAGTL